MKQWAYYEVIAHSLRFISQLSKPRDVQHLEPSSGNGKNCLLGGIRQRSTAMLIMANRTAGMDD